MQDCKEMKGWLLSSTFILARQNLFLEIILILIRNTTALLPRWTYVCLLYEQLDYFFSIKI